MEQTLVSVVIPAYNAASFLGETLQSVLGSSYTNFEIIVVDDGSTDGTLALAEDWSRRDERVRVLTQKNGGASVARNYGISEARGRYILPFDADDLIGSTYIASAAAVLDSTPSVKVVYAEAEFFGTKSGRWNLPPFSLKALALHNLIYICAMYRKEDWERVGGYCTYIRGREDWEFWISTLKDGGDVVKLPEVGLYYRIQAVSKRVVTRKYKRERIAILNSRHYDFFARVLGGPLHYNRTWSKLINWLTPLYKRTRVAVNPNYEEFRDFIKLLPYTFNYSGETVYDKRNTIKRYTLNGQDVFVKSYQLPNFPNRVIYGLFRLSKARRAYEYALRFRSIGVSTPEPVGHLQIWKWGLFNSSYFVSIASTCQHTYADLCLEPYHPKYLPIYEAIGAFTAKMHEEGIWHKDFSGGNILYQEEDDRVKIDILDLNRMRFGCVNMKLGCKNFERFGGDDQVLSAIARAYAKERGYDASACERMVLLSRSNYQSLKNKKRNDSI